MDTHENLLCHVETLLLGNPTTDWTELPEELTWDDLTEVEARIAAKQEAT